MELVLLTALGVGGATVFGALIGFIFKKISHRFSDIVLSFAAGVMLAAGNSGFLLRLQVFLPVRFASILSTNWCRIYINSWETKQNLITMQT